MPKKTTPSRAAYLAAYRQLLGGDYHPAIILTAFVRGALREADVQALARSIDAETRRNPATGNHGD